MKFTEIEKFPFPSYNVHIPWGMLKASLEEHYASGSQYKLDLDPPFQRGYKWSEKQKTEYIEFQLKGGYTGKDIYFNCPKWMHWSDYTKEHGVVPTMELVDGKQRLNAVLEFLEGKVLAFGQTVDQFEEPIRMCKCNFNFYVCNMEKREDIIKWYIAMNTGGSIHTENDLKSAYRELEKNEREELFIIALENYNKKYKPNHPAEIFTKDKAWDLVKGLEVTGAKDAAIEFAQIILQHSDYMTQYEIEIKKND